MILDDSRLKDWGKWLKQWEPIYPKLADGHLDRSYRSPQCWYPKPPPNDLIPDYEGMQIEDIVRGLFKQKPKQAMVLRFQYVWNYLPKTQRCHIIGISLRTYDRYREYGVIYTNKLLSDRF